MILDFSIKRCLIQAMQTSTKPKRRQAQIEGIKQTGNSMQACWAYRRHAPIAFRLEKVKRTHCKSPRMERVCLSRKNHWTHSLGAYMALSDSLLYRGVAPPLPIASLSGRLALYFPLAVLDEMVFRLVAMSTIAWLLLRVAGRHRDWCFWAAILFVMSVLSLCSASDYLASLFRSRGCMRDFACTRCGVPSGLCVWGYGVVVLLFGHRQRLSIVGAAFELSV